MPNLKNETIYLSTHQNNTISSHNNTNMVYSSVQMNTSPKDEFIKQHKKNGLIERLYNGIKNLTGLGTGSKKVNKAIKEAELGKISKTEAQAIIDKYRTSQVNSAQAMGDILSAGAAGATFFGLQKLLKQKGAEALLNEKFYAQKEAIYDTNKILHKNFLKFAKSKSKLIVTCTAAAAFIGGLTKYFAMKINRLGSQEFKYNKKDFNGTKTKTDKIAYKKDKKAKKSARRKANFRNFVSGAINGLMMPITMVGGAIAGIPLYLAGNSLNRYFIGNHEEKNKNFSNYMNNLKNDGILQLAATGVMAVPMIKHAKFAKIFDQNIEKATKKLLDSNLQESGLQGKTPYQELENLLFKSNDIQKITFNPAMSVDEQIQALTNENIFAVKMKQISNDGSALTSVLRENCPPSRATLEEAQQAINGVFGDKYTVKQLLGVGTVAETYLAKNAEGKDVCIKLIKKGLNKEKILTDKEKFVQIIKNSNLEAEEQNNLLRNIDDMTEGLLKELDLSNEMEAAKKLADYTKIANVVKPIEIKDGVYVMEKANGISLSSLVELNSAYFMKDVLTKHNVPISAKKGTKLYTKLKGVTNKDEQLKILNDYIKQIESRTPEFGDINLTKNDFKALIEEYQHVFVEQFNKVNKDGKILHADIHPGNIFIDVNALRNRQEGILQDAKTYLGKRNSNKIFTLIDTGNTVMMDAEQAMRSINLTSYINRANVHDIAEYMLYGVEGAALGGHTKEEAIKLIEKDLQELFFGNKYKLQTVTNESLVEITSNIMRKYGIIPADTQLTLNKARQSANNSLSELYSSLGYFYVKDLLANGGSTQDIVSTMLKAGKDIALIETKYSQMKRAQETMNLKNLTIEQARKHKKNPNMQATNSEEYLTYKLKQKMKFNHDNNIPMS